MDGPYLIVLPTYSLSLCMSSTLARTSASSYTIWSTSSSITNFLSLETIHLRASLSYSRALLLSSHSRYTWCEEAKTSRSLLLASLTYSLHFSSSCITACFSRDIFSQWSFIFSCSSASSSTLWVMMVVAIWVKKSIYYNIVYENLFFIKIKKITKKIFL